MNDAATPAGPRLREVSLDDKYALESGTVFLTGIQALVRLVLDQRRRDAAAGHRTAGYVTGYRGSPLGALDQQMLRAQALLEAHDVKFQPGVNEDLAATACWGTQQAHLDGENAFDGVFALWYGKGPGVDRSGDALRHANLAGTAPLGGALALLGDDHTCESSTTAHHSEYAMVDAMIPVLNPAGVQEVLDYGLWGIALSRYAGCWVALKCVHDTVEAAACVEIDPARIEPRTPDGYDPPEGGLHIRWPDTPQAQEKRLHEHKLEAVKAFCRANRLDEVAWDSPDAKVGVLTTGKSWLDVRQALDDLGVDPAGAERLGLRLGKLAMPFPLEPEFAKDFCAGLDLVIVVEEKRALIETQLKDLMYGRAGAPAIVGKRDEQGRSLFPSAGRLDTNHIAQAIGERLPRGDAALAARVEEMRALVEAPRRGAAAMTRTPYFCAGCPHNSSTRVPEGSRALAGIGCHYLAQFMDRLTARYTQMGAEGASWIGEAPFSRRRHVFQNIGDGTYYHSGLMAIRAAVAAKTDITFKILYNDAVAMTGGQPMDGPLTVPRIAHQMIAEGAARVVVVTDEPEKYGARREFPDGVPVHHRSALDAVQRELREIPGTTVLVYDQTCAAEKRRRRKRGRFPDPPRRVVINEAVCEGCGDCGVQSNCVAIVPVETALGRKRAIDQSACNKDYSCVEGFCPSFVSVRGGRLRRGRAAEPGAAGVGDLPEPALPALDRPCQIIVTGVGGTGVLTIGALLGMAAHLEGRGCSVLDQTGLAQKGGAVVSHVRVAARQADLAATRVANGGADLVLGCDLVVTGGDDALGAMRRGRTRVVVNAHRTMTGDFTRDPDLAFPADALLGSIAESAGPGRVDVVDATRLATALTGDAIATNLFVLGYAWQAGEIPLGAAAIERAIELNGVAVEMNRQAFRFGRRAAVDLAAVERLASPAVAVAAPRPPETLEALVEDRAARLAGYQDAAYAARYRALVERVRAAERERAGGFTGLAEAVARNLYKLLAYKDEYEVARLFASGDFEQQVATRFEGDYTLGFHLAPPLLARRDPRTGHPRKMCFGPWMMTAYRWLARCRRLRGTALDPFGRTAERRAERRLIAEYEAVVEELIGRLAPDNHALAVSITRLPEQIRGFGHVKARHLAEAKGREAELLAALRGDAAPPAAA